MATSPELEAYLEKLDRALAAVSAGDRADIVAEIKSHVLEAQERDPAQSMTSILDSLGDPQEVAYRYLAERGLNLEVAQSPKGSILKWLTAGLVAVFILICGSFVFALWRFSPILSVDAENDRVTVLGGVIDVDGERERVKVGPLEINADSDGKNEKIGPKISGTVELAGAVGAFQFHFQNGEVEVEYTKKTQFRWECRVQGSGTQPTVAQTTGTYSMDFSSAERIKCDLDIPRRIAVQVRGDNGKVKIEEAAAAVDVDLKNGEVEFDPAKKLNYHYDIVVTNGRVKGLQSSADQSNAIPVKIRVQNGLVRRD